ncbi:MAG TPA: nuclear transport factor 2 family protein [Jatrophihabitantaceae bacterium]|nr:nuclear transport factor 2 family protein [Jatrophihabitantaceae bacterium]
MIERWLAAGDKGDVDAFDDLMHFNAVVHAPRGLSTDNRDAEKQTWLDAIAAMPDLRHEVLEVVVKGDTEMARVEVTGPWSARSVASTGPAAASAWIKRSSVIYATARLLRRGRSPTSRR